MNSYKDTVQLSIRFIVATISVILMIIAAKSFAAAFTPRSGPVSITIIFPETPIPTQYSSTQNSVEPLVIKYAIVSLECGSNGNVIAAYIDMKIFGGIAPYYLEFDPNDAIITGIQEETTIRFKLEAGKTVTVIVKSNTPNGEPTTSREIRVADSVCDYQTPPPEPTITQTHRPSLNVVTGIAPAKECNDRIDNDKDGYIDFPNDPQCSSASDDSESHK